MELIEFLLRNWWIVVLLLGLYVQFKKKLGTPQRSDSLPEKVPTSTYNSLPSKRRTLIEKSSSPFSSTSEAYNNQRSIDQTVQPSPERNINEESAVLNQRQLAQGIIWAEILGPPRAKKPFRR